MCGSANYYNNINHNYNRVLSALKKFAFFPFTAPYEACRDKSNEPGDTDSEEYGTISIACCTVCVCSPCELAAFVVTGSISGSLALLVVASFPFALAGGTILTSIAPNCCPEDDYQYYPSMV